MTDQTSEKPVEKPQPEQPNAGKPKSAQRDWKPLGAVRDYFTEQMRQDDVYRR